MEYKEALHRTIDSCPRTPAAPSSPGLVRSLPPPHLKLSTPISVDNVYLNLKPFFIASISAKESLKLFSYGFAVSESKVLSFHAPKALVVTSSFLIGWTKNTAKKSMLGTARTKTQSFFRRRHTLQEKTGYSSAQTVAFGAALTEVATSSRVSFSLMVSSPPSSTRCLS